MPHWGGAIKNRRVSMCLSLVPSDELQGSSDLEAVLREIAWCDRALQWHETKVSHGIGCGFTSGDMYTEFSDSEQDLPPWMQVSSLPVDSPSLSTLEICCSLESPADEKRFAIAELLLQRVCNHLRQLDNGARPLCARACVALVAESSRIPLMGLHNGIATFAVSASSFNDGNVGLDQSIDFLNRAGMFVIPDVVSLEDSTILHQLAKQRIQDAEDALQIEGKDIGCGDVSYAEICSRGLKRWDLLLHAEGERQGRGDVAGDSRFDVLERIATEGPWVCVVGRALGDYKWQASVICSRPGAPAGKWHADGGHSRHIFDGESGQATCICVFIPLVPLELPVETENGEVKHGRGCTAFWPGSQSFRECPHLGSAAATRLRAVVPGAPLGVGSALVYDYRTVHCASPNDASDLADGDRPIIQLTYCFHKYNDVGKNYGYYQLLND